MLKDLFVLEEFTFLSGLYGYLEKQLDKKAILMTSQTGQQIVIVHLLPNISRSKSNQAIKFGQLIEYKMR